MGSVNTVGLRDALRGLCSGDRRLRSEVEQTQREHDELVPAFKKARRMQEPIGSRNGFKLGRKVLGNTDVTFLFYSMYTIAFVNEEGRHTLTMCPTTFSIEGLQTDEEFEVSREFCETYNGRLYKTVIKVTNPSQANGARPLQIFAQVQRMVTWSLSCTHGGVSADLLLHYDYRKRQWVSDISGGHDPIYDAITEGFTVELVDPNNVKWTANAKNGFILKLS